MLEQYKWAVTYDDGTTIHEDGSEGWSSIDEQSVSTISLSTTARGGISFKVDVPPYYKAVFFRRFRQDVNPNTDEAAPRQLFAICIGSQDEETGDQRLLFVCADGQIIMTNADID